MPIPSTIADLSTTANSNSPLGSEPPTEGDNHIRALAAIVKQVYEDQTDVEASVINVKGATYGATGDGVTDDLTAIDAAIAAARALGGADVVFPPGTYRVTGPIILPNDAPITLRGASKSSASGLTANASSIIYADHTSGAAVRLRSENQSIIDLMIQGSPTRAADTDEDGVLIEADDTAGLGTRGCLLRGVSIRDHGRHGVITSGNANHTRFESVTLRNILGHGFVLDDGTVTSRTNTDRPGQISIVDCRAFNVAGHQVKIGNSGGAGAYRILVENFECGNYTTAYYNSGIISDNASCWAHGENIRFEGCAFSGDLDGTPTLSGIAISGRCNRLHANRYISTPSPAIVINQDAAWETFDIVVDGMLVSQDVTLNPAVSIDTGALGVSIIVQNTDQITTVASGDLTDVFVVTRNLLKFYQAIEGLTVKVPTANAQFPIEITRDGAVVGFRATRTGSGASVASIQAAGGGCLLSNGTNNVTIKSNTTNIGTLPTSASGLSTGDLWNDSGTVKVA
jgi:hypothetical protein